MRLLVCPFVVATVVAALPGVVSCRQSGRGDPVVREPAGGAPGAESAPVASTVAPALSSGGGPTGAAPLVCDPACPPGTSCRLAKSGPVCGTCSPGAVPACKDDRFLATCGDDATLHATIDCGAEKKRCLNGVCVRRECTPDAVHCFEGNVHRCDASGNARSLVKSCRKVLPDGSTVIEGVCDTRAGKTACHKDCKAGNQTIVALYDCEKCPWEEVAFCATESSPRGCTDTICVDRQPSFGAVAIPCWRDTDGLALPGSDRPGPCKGKGPVGSRTVAYDACQKGAPVTVSRVEPCRI